MGGSSDLASSRYALAAGLLALVMWSGTAIANKVAVGYMSGLAAGVTRSLIAGVLALVVVFAARLPRPAGARDTALLLISGLASFAIWPMLISVGIERTTASHAAIAMAMIPVFTVLMTNLVDRRLPPAGWWLGAVIAVTATAALVLRQPGDASVGSGPTAAGDLIVLSGSAVCAAGYVAGGRLSARLGSAAVTFWGLVSALVLLVPAFAWLAPATPWATLPAPAWWAIGWMALLSSLVGYGLWFYALSAGGIATIGSLQLAMPVLTILAAAVLLGEAITWDIALITAAIVFGTWWAHRQAQPGQLSNSTRSPQD